MDEEKVEYINQSGNFLDILDFFQQKDPIHSQQKCPLSKVQQKKWQKKKGNQKWIGTQLEIKHIMFYLEYFSECPLEVLKWEKRRPRKLYAQMQEYLRHTKTIAQCIAHDHFIKRTQSPTHINMKAFIISQANQKLISNDNAKKLLAKIIENENYINEYCKIMKDNLNAFKDANGQIEALKVQNQQFLLENSDKKQPKNAK